VKLVRVVRRPTQESETLFHGTHHAFRQRGSKSRTGRICPRRRVRPTTLVVEIAARAVERIAGSAESA
jgi:hypothetical protein